MARQVHLGYVVERHWGPDSDGDFDNYLVVDEHQVDEQKFKKGQQVKVTVETVSKKEVDHYMRTGKFEERVCHFCNENMDEGTRCRNCGAL